MGLTHTTAVASHIALPGYATLPKLTFKFSKISRLTLTIQALAYGCNSANRAAVCDENQLPQQHSHSDPLGTAAGYCISSSWKLLHQYAVRKCFQLHTPYVIPYISIRSCYSFMGSLRIHLGRKETLHHTQRKQPHLNLLLPFMGYCYYPSTLSRNGE